MRCAPAGCRQASRVQAGRRRPGAGRKIAVAHRMCSDVRVCTSMCPLNQDTKSAVKVYTGMYSVLTASLFCSSLLPSILSSIQVGLIVNAITRCIFQSSTIQLNCKVGSAGIQPIEGSRSADLSWKHPFTQSFHWSYLIVV